MAGGVGTRFWPLSTSSHPKQFLKLLGEKSLLQESYARARLLAGPERILVLTGEDFLPLVSQQLPDLPAENVVGEPCRRDTAAAVALGAVLVQNLFGDATMVVLTADHRIGPPEAFREAMLSATEAARREPVLYTFGIPPTHPSTAFGYLEVGERLFAQDGVQHWELRGFREKPDEETARMFLQSGRFLWNSGMFVWSAATILDELRRHLPTHVDALSRATAAFGSPGWKPALAEAFASLSAISIDYGVMEKAQRVRAVVGDFAWSDLGGWLALQEFLPEDGQGNRHRGRVAGWQAAENLVFSEDPEELVALVGVRDLVVVRAGKRTLVVDKAHAEAVKELVRLLEREGQGRFV